MLVLGRRTAESIILGTEGDIEIKILEIRGNYVRLGITAPQSLPVYRNEIYARIQQQNEDEHQELKTE